MAHDVFISYSSLDRNVAEAICASLESEGMRAWIAPRDILPGASWGESIIDAINASKLMVVVFSSSSNDSNQVLREVERAVAKKLPIIPFRIENVLPSRSMEYFLSSSHWLDALTAPSETHIRKLTNIVKQSVVGHADLDDLADSHDPATAGLKSGIGELAPASIWARLASRRMRRRYLLAAAALGPVAVGTVAWRWHVSSGDELDPHAIAVLPFHNVANDQSVEGLSVTVPLELNALLSRMTSAIIRPFESVKIYRNQTWTPAEVAKTLRVGTMVVGSFFRSGQGLKVNVDIIETRRNRQVWGEIFEALESDNLGLIGRMVPRVAEALKLRLESSSGGEMLGTRNEESYELYLRALSLGQEITDDNNKQTIRLLKDSVSRDPAFARAYAALAEAYVTRFYWNFSNDTEWLKLAEASARQALQLDSALPEAHNALAQTLESKGMRAAAAREFFAGVSAAPNYAVGLANAARWLFYMAEFDASAGMLDRLARVDPTYNVHIRKAMCFFFSGRLPESRRENQLAERQAKGVDQLTLVAFSWVWLKDLEAAERILHRLEKEQPSALSISEVRAWLYTARGRVKEAREQMDILRKRETYGIMDGIATFYAIQGDRDRAIEWLAKAVKLGAPNYAWYRSDFFKVARGDARYEAILKQLEDEYRPLRPSSNKKS